MRRSAFLLLVAVAVVVLAGTTGAVTDPTVTLDRTGTTAGEEMVVTGTGWPDGATLVVELCGQGGIHGSVDCDVSHQRTAGVGPSGTFSTTLTVAKPPTACPCVVKATDQTSHIAATAAIAVAGVATVPIADDDPDAVRRIEITGATIGGGGAWTEHFGAPSPRVLHLTLVNTGAVAVRRPVLAVAWGKGTEPTGFVRVPDLEAMEPGATQQVTVDLPRGALAFGEYTAVAEVQGLAERVRTTTSTSSYPWGLVAAAFVVLQLLLLHLRNRVRRRFRRGAEPEPIERHPDAPALPRAPLALPAGPAVIDLRDDDAVIDLDEITAEPAVDVPALDGDAEEATTEPPPGPVLAAGHNGHNGNGNGSGSGHQNGQVLIELVSPTPAPAASHVDDTAALTAELLKAFSAASAAAEAEAEDCARRARASLSRAAELSDSLVAAAEARASELARQAEARDEVSHERLAASAAVLDSAREQAALVVAQAQSVAQEILTAAAEEQARAEAHRSALERERAGLVEAARSRVEAIVQELQSEADDLARSLQARAVDLLQQASDERRALTSPTPPPADELDRRLARAVTAALSGR